MPSPRKNGARLPSVEELRKQVLAKCAGGPVSWGEIPTGRMAEQATWLVGEGELHVVTINGKAYLIKKKHIDEMLRSKR